MSSSELDRTEAETPDRSPWKDRAVSALALVNSGGFATLSALLLGTTLAVLLSADRSALTGIVLIVWGALACFLSFRAGAAQKPALDGLRMVLAYALGTLLVFLVLNGLYRLFGA